MQTLQWPEGHVRLDAGDDWDITAVDCEPIRAVLDDPSELASEQRGGWPEDFNPRLLDVRIGQSPTVKARREDRRDV